MGRLSAALGRFPRGRAVTVPAKSGEAGGIIPRGFAAGRSDLDKSRMLLEASHHQPRRPPRGPVPSALCGHAHTLLEQWGSDKTQGTQRKVHP